MRGQADRGELLVLEESVSVILEEGQDPPVRFGFKRLIFKKTHIEGSVEST